MRIAKRSATSLLDAGKEAIRVIVASWITRSSSIMRLIARVVKLVYTAGLKPAAANHGMPVRFRSLAPHSVHFRQWCAKPHAKRMRAQAMSADVLLEKIAKKKNAWLDKLFCLISALEFPDFVTI